MARFRFSGDNFDDFERYLLRVELRYWLYRGAGPSGKRDRLAVVRAPDLVRTVSLTAPDMQVQIRASIPSETQAIADLAMVAFGTQGEDVAGLIVDLLADPSAEPWLSLIAIAGDRIVGQILFTNARIDGCAWVRAVILAPLCVHPEFQARGIGSQLVEEGLAAMTAAGIELVFVLGYPGYYSRHGFFTAGTLGFEATYPILAEQADAWMVRELRPGAIGSSRGRVRCAAALDRPEHWRE